MNLRKLDEYVGATDYPVPPTKIGLIRPDQLPHFKAFFGSKVSDFYNNEIYYAGKTDDGLHIFTNKDSWIKYRQELKRNK